MGIMANVVLCLFTHIKFIGNVKDSKDPGWNFYGYEIK